MTVLSRLIVTKMFDIQRRGAISCSSVSLLLRRYNVHRTLMIQRSFSTETPKSSENELVLRRIREDDDFEDDDVGSKRGGSTFRNVIGWIFTGSIVSLVVWAGYSITMELFGRASPTNLFDETFEIIRISDEIIAITGDPMRAYGMDSGRNEGRRNHVSSRKYVDPHDLSNRLRIRYTVSGPKGRATVYAEISDKMLSTEFVYLICQDRRSGRVVTLEDNRFKLMSSAQAVHNEPNIFTSFVDTVKDLLSVSKETPPEPASQPSDTFSSGKSKYD